MFLRTLRIQGFRCFKDHVFKFRPGINLIVGENDTGKTAVLDAIRLAIGVGSQRDLYLDFDSDIFRDGAGVPAKQAQIDLSFGAVTDEDRWVLYEMQKLDQQNKTTELELHVRYWQDETRTGLKPRFRLWGGEDEAQSIPTELMGDLFYHVHLGALRDASRDLRPSRGSKLGQLVDRLAPEEDRRKGLEDRLAEALDDDEWKKLLREAESKINTHLQRSSLRDSPAATEATFLPPKFKQITEELKLVCRYMPPVPKEQVEAALTDDPSALNIYFEPARQGLLRLKDRAFEQPDDQRRLRLFEVIRRVYKNTLDVGQTGLGTANLIYLATVFGDLRDRRHRDPRMYAALLLEEPESHLHPQLQTNLYSYLCEMANDGVQVFITTHSPTIASTAELDSLTILQRDLRQEVHSVSPRSFDLPPKTKRQLERFLDVTKSQLLFARGVLLVEGISEALLMPAFARRMGAGFELHRKGVEIVNIGGVAFEPFASLFNAGESSKRLQCRAAILTDEDSTKEGAAARVDACKRLAGVSLKVLTTPHTFEHVLYVDNEMLILRFLRENEWTAHVPNDILDISARAAYFVEHLSTSRTRSKAVFAQEFADKLADDANIREELKVPDYIERAVRWVVDGIQPDG